MMRKILLLLLLFFFLSDCYSLEKLTSVFDEIELPYGVSFVDEDKYEIAYFVYRNKNDVSIIWEGSGIIPRLTTFYEDKDFVFVEFYLLWIGSEVTIKNDCRKLYKYFVKINKKDILSKKEKILIESPKIILHDKQNISINNNLDNKFFFTNKTSLMYKNPDKQSEIVRKIYNNEKLELLDISYDKVGNVWFKLKYNDYAGFIMINDISEQWTVIKNEMSKIEQ